MKSILITVCFMLFSGQAFSESNFSINVEILNGDESIGSPMLIVEPGVKAVAAVEGIYKMSLLASPLHESKTFLETNMEIGHESWNLSMIIKLGEKAKVTVGDKNLIFLVDKA